MVVLTDLYQFMLFSVTLFYLQVHNSGLQLKRTAVFSDNQDQTSYDQ